MCLQGNISPYIERPEECTTRGGRGQGHAKRAQSGNQNSPTTKCYLHIMHKLLFALLPVVTQAWLILGGGGVFQHDAFKGCDKKIFIQNNIFHGYILAIFIVIFWTCVVFSFYIESFLAD